MPAYNSNPGGGEDMYSDAESSPASTETKEKPESEEGKEPQGETALIPKSLCPDMKPGEEVVLRIVRGLENDWEVEYAPKKEGESESEPAASPPAVDSNYE